MQLTYELGQVPAQISGVSLDMLAQGLDFVTCLGIGLSIFLAAFIVLATVCAMKISGDLDERDYIDDLRHGYQSREKP